MIPGSLIFQHDRSFCLNKVVQFIYGDPITHVAIVNDTKLDGDAKIINVSARGFNYDDKLGLLYHRDSYFEVWFPNMEILTEELIKTALIRTIEKFKDTEYGYLQLFGYWIAEKLGIDNPWTKGTLCSEATFFYGNYLNVASYKGKSKDKIRPQENYLLLQQTDYFKLGAIKHYNTDILKYL